MILYHATGVAAADAILREGLTVPRQRLTTGSRAYPGIYLYRTQRDAELHVPALFYTGSLPYEVPYVVLEVRLPSGYRTYRDPESFAAVIVNRDIPARYIRILEEHGEDYSEFEDFDWDAD